MLITANQTGKASEIIDYNYVNELENDDILIRHTKQKDDVLTDNDMTAAGVMLQQIWITGKTKEDVIAKEHEIREKIYKTDTDADYPPYWQI